jgi:hypothetical protein
MAYGGRMRLNSVFIIENLCGGHSTLWDGACVFVCAPQPCTLRKKKVAALNGGCFAYAIYAFIPSLLLLLADGKPRFWNSSS